MVFLLPRVLRAQSENLKETAFSLLLALTGSANKEFTY